MLNNTKITLITSNYPMITFPERGVFVEALAQQWKKMDVSISVINPVSFQNQFRYGKVKAFEIFNSIPVYRPTYISYSNYRFLGFNTNYFSQISFVNAALKICNKIEKPDLYYGKFLMGSGFAASLAGEKFKKPSFADLGESKLLESYSEKDKYNAKKIIKSLTGIICVSERLQKEVLELGAKPENVFLAPNEANTELFKKKDKTECRKKLGLPENSFIVAFTGHFIERKGPLRVLKAIEALGDKVYGVFLGRGKQIPTGQKVLFAGALPNNELPDWLCASDVFVFPTLAEGHCNAINEAIACELPIITSDISDMKEQLGEKAAIFVNPHDIREISNSISKIMTNNDFANQLISASKNNEKPARGKKIADWMFQKIEG